jgi:hypothetical protein
MAKVSRKNEEIQFTQEHEDMLNEHELTLRGVPKDNVPGIVRIVHENNKLLKKIFWVVGAAVGCGTVLGYAITHFIDTSQILK